MAPLPKDPALRQRRNRAPTYATLKADGQPSRAAPPLPRTGRKWQKLTRQFWRDIWASPMAAEFLNADIHGLYLLIELVDRFWVEPTQPLAAEIRLQRMCFGLTPVDRRRLQWEVERVESATVKRQPPRPAPVPGDDPRRLLTVVQ